MGKPDDGAYINGLFMEGAMWDRKTSAVNESNPKVLYDTIPIILLIPTKRDEIDKTGTYACPIYKTSERKGTLSTTGHSTNFVKYFPVSQPLEDSSHWVARGVAMLCMLDE